MTAKTDRLLTMDQAAELLGTSPSFPRKLISDRKIRFVRVGKLLRIPESALTAYIAAATVEPVTAWSHRRRRIG
jgi:excisionase family DNA binding protein